MLSKQPVLRQRLAREQLSKQILSTQSLAKQTSSEKWWRQEIMDFQMWARSTLQNAFLHFFKLYMTQNADTDCTDLAKRHRLF